MHIQTLTCCEVSRAVQGRLKPVLLASFSTSRSSSITSAFVTR